MNNRRINKVGMSTLALLTPCLVGVSQAAEILINSDVIDQAMDVVAQKYEASAEAQEEISRLQNSASSNFEEFKRSNDTLETLLVLNAGWRKQISGQVEQIATLDESIAGVEEITQGIPLLMEKMISSLEQFIELDYPFHVNERENRLQFARDAIDNPDVSIAEKFRQVLVMYQTDTSYGRTIETYPDTNSLYGADRD